MTSLERTVEITKKVLIGFLIGLGCIIFIVILVNIISSIRKAFFPPTPAGPSVAFGKLDQIPFDDNGEKGNFTYSLQTVSGTLPTLSDREEVFKINNAAPSLLNLSNAKSIVAAGNFTSDPTAISDTNYEWTNSTPSSTLVMNIINNNFTYSYDYNSDPNVLQGINLTDTIGAINTATTFFNTYISTLPSDINVDNPNTSFFSINNGNFTSVPSLSQAQAIRVDFFPNNVNKLSIYYPTFPNSLMYAYVGGGADNSQVIKASYFHVNISNQNSTYPIISSQDAFNDLKNGNAYILPSYTGSKNVNIRNVSVVYFIANDNQNYLMPVIVFQGDNNFYAVVSAVKGEWIK